MEETIDTRGKYDKDLPNGEREFRVENIRSEGEGKKFRYIWQLTFKGNEDAEVGEQTFFANQLSDLLRVLGCEEVAPKRFKWDRDILVGSYFIATVSHDPDKNDATKIRQNMTGFKKSDKTDETPF